MPEVRLTRAFETEKSRFLSANGDSGMLAGAIKKILRRLAEIDPPSNKGLGQTSIPVQLGTRKYAVLSCLYAVNHDKGEIAPVCLSFPDLQARTPVSLSRIPGLLETVLDELGWD